MTRIRRIAISIVVFAALFATSAHAQFVVYDPTNYAQALSRYAQLLEEYRFFVEQAKRLPVDMASRYRVPAISWHINDPSGIYQYARSILASLNAGDSAGTGYNRSVDQLEPLADALPSVPPAFQQRLTNAYGTIQLDDSTAITAINQVGQIRTNGSQMLTAIGNMENDAVADSDDFHTQTALLNKINGATVLALRINENTSQFQLHILEQLLVQNMRARDAEAEAMNARLFQWQYGAAYGQDLFSRTAANLDGWRQP